MFNDLFSRPNMNTIIEIHDSTVAEIFKRDGTVIVHFLPAYLHKSTGRPALDSGTGWVQEARLIFLRHLSLAISQIGRVILWMVILL